jgi:N utilization substance protein B
MINERRRNLRELALQVLFSIDSVYPEIFGKPPKHYHVSNNHPNQAEPRSKIVRAGVRKRIVSKEKTPETHDNALSDQPKLLTDEERLLQGNKILDDFWLNFRGSYKGQDFFLLLTRGVIKHISVIDKKIEQFSSNWKLERMTCVDRNILRIAVFEIIYCSDIPYKVSINEAIDIGKKFGTKDSGSFLNGVLDSIRISIESEKANKV